MDYALSILWHERSRFLPGILAVGFSTLLIALQLGLLLGMFAVVSIPVDRSSADLWVGHPGVESVDLGLPVPVAWRARLEAHPEVERTEAYIEGVVYWPRRQGGTDICFVVGSPMEPLSLGTIADLTSELRGRLTEPGAIVVDEEELPRLGLRGVGDTAEVNGCRVRVVGLVQRVKALGGVYLFCSLQTARMLLRIGPDQATYLLVRCRHPAQARAVADRLRRYANLSAFTSAELSRASQVHWLVKTKAGLALSCAALLGLLVGAAVTSQTLYAATVASLREFAVLAALGIPRWRSAGLILTEALWVGLLGVGLALPTAFGLAWVFTQLGAQVALTAGLLIFAAVLTLGMALLSGLIALRSLRLVEPAALLR